MQYQPPLLQPQPPLLQPQPLQPQPLQYHVHTTAGLHAQTIQLDRIVLTEYLTGQLDVLVEIFVVNLKERVVGQAHVVGLLMIFYVVVE